MVDGSGISDNRRNSNRSENMQRLPNCGHFELATPTEPTNKEVGCFVGGQKLSATPRAKEFERLHVCSKSVQESHGKEASIRSTSHRSPLVVPRISLLFKGLPRNMGTWS
jgi:hypothetical protein